MASGACPRVASRLAATRGVQGTCSAAYCFARGNSFAVHLALAAKRDDDPPGQIGSTSAEVRLLLRSASVLNCRRSLNEAPLPFVIPTEASEVDGPACPFCSLCCDDLAERPRLQVDSYCVIWSLCHSAVALRMKFNGQGFRIHDHPHITIICVVVALEG